MDENKEGSCSKQCCMDQQDIKATLSSFFTVQRHQNTGRGITSRRTVSRQDLFGYRRLGIKVTAERGQNPKGPFGRKDDKKEVGSRNHV